jgi:ribosome-associated translation inhibitor RaiA
MHEHDEHTVELNLSVPGTKLNTRIASDNMTKSIDLAVDKMGVRLKKFTSKQQAH